MLKDFFSLIFPQVCVNCESTLISGEKYLCFKCNTLLPKYKDSGLSFDYRFWGKIDIINCHGFLKYTKGGIAQKMIFALKYDGQRGIGEQLGKWFGYQLLEEMALKDVDCIIAVPLHKSKQRIRGYNQSEEIAMGISSVVGIPVNFKELLRKEGGTSLTKINRIGRWRNSTDLYKTQNFDSFKGKHVLIIDDVITTGATFEAVAKAVYEGGASKVSIAALAVAV